MLHVFRSKMTRRYLLITLVALVLALSTIYTITTCLLSSSIRNQIESRDELFTNTLGDHIGFVMQSIVDDMRVESNFLLTSSSQDRSFYNSEMDRVVENNPLYLNVAAFDKQGHQVRSVPISSFSDPAAFAVIQKQLAWSKTSYISEMITCPNGMQTIAVAYPAIDGNGEYQGGVIAYLNLNELSEDLKKSKIGSRGFNALLDRQGTIVANSDARLIGRSLKQHVLGDELYKERYGIWQGQLFNQTMIAGYMPLSIGGFSFIAGEPLDQALAPSQHVTALLFDGFMFVLTLSIGLTILGTSRFVRPIDRLIQQVREYKDNKRQKFDRIQTNDELGELSFVMRQMAQELTDKERRLFYILESIPYGVITTDKDGRITTANKGAEKLTLFNREEAVGQYIFDLTLKESKEDLLAWHTLQEGREYHEIETYIIDKQGEKHDVKLYSSLFYDEEDRLLGAILVLRDVSDLKKLEAYLKQSERLDSLGQLTAGVAHEIKNPLSIIQAATEAIQLELQDPQPNARLIEQWTHDIMETTDRMNEMLTHFLMLSKSGEDVAWENVNLVQILDELLHLLRKRIVDLGISVERHFDQPEAWVYGNKNRLTQVFLNILVNNLQAMDNGGRLDVSLIEREHSWEVQIEDTGKGIPESKLKWIFNPFFSTKREGTGLGLSIAYEIIMQHEGKIMAESTEGVGTTLFVQLSKAVMTG